MSFSKNHWRILFLNAVRQFVCFFVCCCLGACVSNHETVTDYYVVPFAGNEIPPSSREGVLGSLGYVSVQPVLFNIKTSNFVSKLVVGEKVGSIYPAVFIASVRSGAVVVTNATGQLYDLPVMDTSAALGLRDVIMQKMQEKVSADEL